MNLLLKVLRSDIIRIFKKLLNWYTVLNRIIEPLKKSLPSLLLKKESEIEKDSVFEFAVEVHY